MADKRKTTGQDEPETIGATEQTPLHMQVVERIPSTVGGISALASANAPQVYFDRTPFCGYALGVGSITLTATRQIAQLADGLVVNDQVITGILRAPLETLQALKATIEVIEKLAEQQLVSAVHAATGGMPPSGSMN